MRDFCRDLIMNQQRRPRRDGRYPNAARCVSVSTFEIRTRHGDSVLSERLRNSQATRIDLLDT